MCLPSSLFRSDNHRVNYCKFKLSFKIEKNPGPIVDPSKTIHVLNSFKSQTDALPST